MRKFQITFKGQVYELDVEEITGGPATPPASVIQPKATIVPMQATVQKPKEEALAVSPGAKAVAAPLPGKILTVNIKNGDSVKRGDVIIILEAMKMQNEIMAAEDAVVADVRVTVAQTVSTGDVLVVFA